MRVLTFLQSIMTYFELKKELYGKTIQKFAFEIFLGTELIFEISEDLIVRFFARILKFLSISYFHICDRNEVKYDLAKNYLEAIISCFVKLLWFIINSLVNASRTHIKIQLNWTQGGHIKPPAKLSIFRVRKSFWHLNAFTQNFQKRLLKSFFDLVNFLISYGLLKFGSTKSATGCI